MTLSPQLLSKSTIIRRWNPVPRTLAALLAGAVAIALNTAALAAADLVPLATAHGGLLRLLVVRPRRVACQRRGGIAGDERGFRWKPPSDAGWHGLVRRGAYAVLCCLGRPLRAFARWTYIARCLTEVRYAPGSLKVR